MGRKDKKYNYIYKTINIINNKFYIGMHSTNNLEDGYIGSGKRLWYSLNKYGKENHKVEILEFYNSRKLLKERERDLINDNMLNDPMCMNLVIGGGGGVPINIDLDLFHKMGGKKSGKIHAERLKNDIEYAKRHKELFLLNIKKADSEGKCPRFSNKKHSDESKKKMSIKASQRFGNKNSQYNTCWVTNGNDNKKIKKNNEIPNGWILGRTIKKNI